MAHFSKPTDGNSTGYIAKQPTGLGFLRVPVRQTRDLLLFDGFDGGKPLVVRPNDATSPACSVGFTELTALGTIRRFRVSAVSLGTTMVEARSGSATGTVRDFVQVNVVSPPGPFLGHNGSMPAKFEALVYAAIDQAWRLNDKPAFVDAFRRVVSTLSGVQRPSSVYAESLSRMVINLADTTTDLRVKKGILDEARDVKAGALSGAAPSYSFRNQPDIWIRESALRMGTTQITSCIFHEAAHVAGARGDILAEIALDVLHNTANIRR